MTRMCWLFSELGVVEKTPMIKVQSAIAGIKRGNAKKDIEGQMDFMNRIRKESPYSYFLVFASSAVNYWASLLTVNHFTSLSVCSYIRSGRLSIPCTLVYNSAFMLF
jgi:hypothetical protein